MKTSDEILTEMWQAYVDQQCGWQDAMTYHGHSECDRLGIAAAHHILYRQLEEGMPESVERPLIPDHFESRERALRETSNEQENN